MLMETSNGDDRVTTVHRAKLAYVYVRQSTAGQVRQHQESTQLQYRMVDRAALLGGPRERVQVIDEDLMPAMSRLRGWSPVRPSTVSSWSARRCWTPAG